MTDAELVYSLYELVGAVLISLWLAIAVILMVRSWPRT